MVGKESTWCLLVPPQIKKECIWNFGTAALRKLLPNIANPFWRDVVSAWISFSTAFSLPDELLCNENIFNSDVTKYKRIKYSSWEKNGAKFVGDLFEERRLITWERFKEKYDIDCIHFEYYSLLRSLPDSLKHVRVSQCYQQPPLPARLQYLLSNNTYTQFFVKTMIRVEQGFQKDINRIESKWIRDVESFEPLSVVNVRNSVSATRYTSFQFKLVMRILTTNTFLKLIRVQENHKCSFCQEDSETLTHLFLTCKYVNKLWNDIAQYMSRHGLRQLSNNIKIFGDRNSALITHIVTVVKYVIYDARSRGIHPHFNYCKMLLTRDFNTERHVASKNDKTEHFRNKWNELWSDMNSNPSLGPAPSPGIALVS